MFLLQQVCCGKNHTLALTSDGHKLFSWGDGEFGKLGIGSTTSKSTPTLVENVRNVQLKKIACGSKFSVVLGHNGLVYTFGHSELILLLFTKEGFDLPFSNEVKLGEHNFIDNPYFLTFNILIQGSTTLQLGYPVSLFISGT